MLPFPDPRHCESDATAVSTAYDLPWDEPGAIVALMEQAGSIFDDVDEVRKARAIAEARADVAAGRVVPHEIVAAWLLKTAEALEKGEALPPAPRSGVPR